MYLKQNSTFSTITQKIFKNTVKQHNNVLPIRTGETLLLQIQTRRYHYACSANNDLYSSNSEAFTSELLKNIEETIVACEP